MVNEHRAMVVDIRNVHLKFTSRKNVTLTNVPHFMEISGTLVSGNHLGKQAIRYLNQLGNFFFYFNGTFIGKDYSGERRGKLCIIGMLVLNFLMRLILFFLWHD